MVTFGSYYIGNYEVFCSIQEEAISKLQLILYIIVRVRKYTGKPCKTIFILMEGEPSKVGLYGIHKQAMHSIQPY